DFGKVINAFKSLDAKDQSIILNITRQVGTGMGEYGGKTDSIETKVSNNLYCHYVTGSVIHVLTALFVHSGLKDVDPLVHEHLSNNFEAGKTWWPKEIWQYYAADLDESTRLLIEKKVLNI
ncbi:unnamed protein product, partial [Rotaria sp. Silwood1]